MTEQNYEQMRRAMVDSQLRTTAVNDPRVIAAMANVARERFVPADLAPLAYLDKTLPVAPGRGMASPMVIGRLLTEARVREGDRTLVVGAGTGYSAAVLAALGAVVTALEEDKDLAGKATPGVTRAAGPLAKGWARGAPYNLILFDGAVEQIPAAIVSQLADGGRLAAPILQNGVTRLALGRRGGDGFGMQSFADADAPILPGFAIETGFSF